MSSSSESSSDEDDIPLAAPKQPRRNNENDVIMAHQNIEQGNVDTEDRVSIGQNIEEVTSFNTVDLDEAFWVANTSASLVRACSCENQDWDTFEKFLSDEKISKRKKKLVLEKDHRCRRWAFCYGAPVSVIKHLVEIEGPATVACTVLGENEGSWLHNAMTCFHHSFEVINLLVNTGGKDLVCLKSNYTYHWKRTAFHMHLRPWDGSSSSPEIIDLFCRIGGVELLEMADNDGFFPLDYTDASQRSIMIESLSSLEQSKGIQCQIEALKSLVLSPREFYDCIDELEFEKVQSYLENINVSRETKVRCLKFRDPTIDFFPFHKFCQNLGPPDIAHTMIELMDDDFLLAAIFHSKDTCLHQACHYETEVDDIDLENQYELVKMLIHHGGVKLLQKSEYQETALHYLVKSYKINMKAISLMIEVGGEELICMQRCKGNTVLHLVSEQEEPNKELILYLVSKGGSRLREIRNAYGKKAEEYWTPEIKEYMILSTTIPPSLLEELQCPICFETMSNVHIITQCCHRFCRKCIMESFRCSGNNCPVCRTKYELSDVRKDPLLGKFAMEFFAGKKRERALQDRNKALLEEVASLKRQCNNV